MDEVKLNDVELGEVDGGYGEWWHFAKGTYVNYGSYIVYTIASGDVLSGIAPRFGVGIDEICKWNNIQDANKIYAGQQIIIYPRILR